MIIHASMRTDIPAFYSEWFINRIREGYIILDQKSIGVSQYFFGLSERKNGIRYEDELEECGIPSKTWKQAGQMELQD